MYKIQDCIELGTLTPNTSIIIMATVVWGDSYSTVRAAEQGLFSSSATKPIKKQQTSSLSKMCIWKWLCPCKNKLLTAFKLLWWVKWPIPKLVGEARHFPILQVPYLLFGVSLIEPQACTHHLWIIIYTVSMLIMKSVPAIARWI